MHRAWPRNMVCTKGLTGCWPNTVSKSTEGWKTLLFAANKQFDWRRHSCRKTFSKTTDPPVCSIEELQRMKGGLYIGCIKQTKKRSTDVGRHGYHLKKKKPRSWGEVLPLTWWSPDKLMNALFPVVENCWKKMAEKKTLDKHGSSSVLLKQWGCPQNWNSNWSENKYSK